MIEAAQAAAVTFLVEVPPDAVSDDVLDEPDSRAATDELMHALRAAGYTPVAWSRFLVRATRRSGRQALNHRRALLEVTVLHVGLGVLADPRRHTWVVVSWLLAAGHLGMLEGRDTLGSPTRSRCFGRTFLRWRTASETLCRSWRW